MTVPRPQMWVLVAALGQAKPLPLLLCNFRVEIVNVALPQRMDAIIHHRPVLPIQAYPRPSPPPISPDAHHSTVQQQQQPGIQLN